MESCLHDAHLFWNRSSSSWSWSSAFCQARAGMAVPFLYIPLFLFCLQVWPIQLKNSQRREDLLGDQNLCFMMLLTVNSMTLSPPLFWSSSHHHTVGCYIFERLLNNMGGSITYPSKVGVRREVFLSFIVKRYLLTNGNWFFQIAFLLTQIEENKTIFIVQVTNQSYKQ